MKNTVNLVPGTRAYRLACRAEFVKEHQPLLWDAPQHFSRDDWFHLKLCRFRATQNKRRRVHYKALHAKLSHDYTQYMLKRHSINPADI